MKMKQNLHTHCVYCDGIDTPDRLAERAIELGFDSLGFSSHANTRFLDTCELRDNTELYRKKIIELKAEYEGRLKIYLGTELDRFSEGIVDPADYDYTIASTHYTVKDGECVSFDISPRNAEDAFVRLFNSDPMAYARAYYETLADMGNHIKGDFVGHFDLVTKYERILPHLFDTGAAEYRKMALEALDAVREKYEFFEVNTGVIGRGYKDTPYPAPFILKRMHELGCKMIVTTDCHNSAFLDVGFDTAIELLRSHGFSEIYELDGRSFVGRKI